MKTIRFFSIALLSVTISMGAMAQKKTTETVAVSGNCGMCKSSIEKAAKGAGATSADWDKDAKQLKVTYKSGTTDLAKIQNAVAAVGYDTRDVKATDAAYDKLHACCKYDRAAAATEAKSCCAAGCDMKDGKCKDMADCKGKGCCKDAAACKEKGCCSAGKADAAKADKASCCKDEKGSIARADGKSCCTDAH